MLLSLLPSEKPVDVGFGEFRPTFRQRDRGLNRYTFTLTNEFARDVVGMTVALQEEPLVVGRPLRAV